MKILITGSGGREHALAWKLAQDERVKEIFVAPGNGGTANEEKCKNIDIKYNDTNALLKFAKDNNITLTIVGPEEPLSNGIVDEFEKNNLLIFGPSKEAAQIEASKSFAKKVMTDAGIPTAAYAEFTDLQSALRYLENKPYPVVVKADGLAAGKGVTVAFSKDEAVKALNEIFLDKVFGESGNIVVIEEFMQGEEATYLAITDGKNIIPLDISQDHKQVFDEDQGPNTGGMGAYTPAPVINDALFKKVTDTIAKPMIDEFAKRGIIYKGVIYAGLMVKNGDIKVVEFNARFGDPECQVVLSRVKSGLLDALIASAKGDLSGVKLEKNNEPVVCVVLTSGGYPKDYKSGYEIDGADKKEENGVKIFHAGTKIENGKLVTNGGRVLCITASATDIPSAIQKAYSAVKGISFKDMHYRKDIAQKALKKI